MKKRLCLSLALVLAVGLLCSCGKNDLEADYEFSEDSIGDIVEVVEIGSLDSLINNTDPYDELITTELDIHTFMEVYKQPPFETDTIYLKEVVSHIGIECLRYTDEGALYSVHKVKQGGLIYIFYHTYRYIETKNVNDIEINRWFYVREQLSSENFKNLTENKSTINDVIKIDKTAQLIKNVCDYDIEKLDLDVTNSCGTFHYLKDGIYECFYHYEDGEFILCYTSLNNEFKINDYFTGGYSPQSKGRILDMDWVE